MTLFVEVKFRVSYFTHSGLGDLAFFLLLYLLNRVTNILKSLSCFARKGHVKNYVFQSVMKTTH